MRNSFRLSAATIYLYASSSLIIIHHSRLMLYHQTTFARRELIDDERTAHLCERTQYVDPRNRLDQPHHVECLHFSRVATAAVLLLFLSPKIPRDYHTSSSNIHHHQPCQFHLGPSYFSWKWTCFSANPQYKVKNHGKIKIFEMIRRVIYNTHSRTLSIFHIPSSSVGIIYKK